MSILLRLALVVLAFAALSPACAEVVSNADVTYFIVEGSTPAEIYHNILDRGPRVNGARALASIGTRATQDGGLKQDGGACRVTGYVITLDFLIERPRIANEQVLSSGERAMWKQMNGFIAAHENQHKKVWQDYAADLDRRITALTAATCDEVGQKAQALWAEMLAACDKTQRSFDEEQSRALLDQPFMRRALQSAP